MTTKSPPVPDARGKFGAAAARIVPAGDSALSVILGDAMDRIMPEACRQLDLSRRVLALGERVMAEGGAGLIEVVPGMASLTVHFDPEVRDVRDLSERLSALVTELPDVVALRRARRWTFPACYDPALALDLAEVAERSGLHPDEIVNRHAGRYFHVYMLGFLPGFPYMGDLDEALQLPRRANPRVEVPAGSVAIAGAMTAIYPNVSPGGWHVIGRTPVPLFDVTAVPPSVLAPGDAVRFDAVSREDYERIADGVRAGNWRLAPDADTG